MIPYKTSHPVITLAYIAGLFDGEGCVFLRPRHGETKAPTGFSISITNTNKDCLNFVQERFGGTIREKIRKNGNKQCYVWTLYGRNAFNFLIKTMKYMIIKRKQARLARTYYEWVIKFGKKRWQRTNQGLPPSYTPTELKKLELFYHKLKELKLSP